MKRHRALGVGLLLLGILLVANPLYIYQYPDEINRVQVGTLWETEPAANYSYEELSPRAQELVRTAVESDSNVTTFHGDHRRPTEFQFSAGAGTDRIAGELYLVTYNGTTYPITTYESAPVKTESRRSQGMLGFGMVVGIAGALFIYARQPLRIGLGLFGAGAFFLVSNLLYRYSRSTLGGLNVLGSSIVLTLALLIGIVSVGFLLYRTSRRHRLAGTESQ
jgi:hypothetical protein